MLKITDFTMQELLQLYDNCQMWLDSNKLTVANRQVVLKDQHEIFEAMEEKIPHNHLQQIEAMKEDRQYKKIASIEERYLTKLRELESKHNRERIRDLFIAIGLSAVVITLPLTIVWFAPEIDAFIQTQYSK